MADDVRRELPVKIYDSFFKFSFVRNSWDLEVSLYHFMRQEQTHFQHEIAKSLPNFEAYVEWRLTQNRRHQRDFLADKNGDLIVDFVGRYDSLEKDFGTICRRIGVEAKLPHLRRSAHAHYSEYYNDRTKALIEEYHRVDIDTFHFEFERMK